MIIRKLTEEQERVLLEADSATKHKIGLRASFWPTCKSLEKRGLVVKKGRPNHMLYFVTEEGATEALAIRARIANRKG